MTEDEIKTLTDKVRLLSFKLAQDVKELVNQGFYDQDSSDRLLRQAAKVEDIYLRTKK